MDQLALVIGLSLLFGSGLIGGVFFAFSCFVMKALARLASSTGIAAMQSINIVVINPLFLGVFMGTALLSLGMLGYTIGCGADPSALYYLGGSIIYLAGTFVITLSINVPLNNKLAAVSACDPASSCIWDRYLTRWTFWNHVRTMAAIMAALLFTLGFMQNG